MLRLKAVLDELKIPQQALVQASGWSKAQVSISLSSGKLPANAEKFIADVIAFINATPVIEEWLKLTGLTSGDLFQQVDDSGLPQMNGNGETPGFGPKWACGEYGAVGHDYQHCHNCLRRYEGHLQRKGAAIFREVF
ncbi:MAG: hypothetical protein M0T70_02785 [Geobacteraceae bacterium]|nr:hypothetical protein [Geobacteraceae bacterium]